MSASHEQTKLGPLVFAAGVGPLNATTVIYAAFVSVPLTIFVVFAQPYILNEVLHVPMARQGSLTGLIQALSEVMIILVVPVAGALSDRLGRRTIYMFGFLVEAIAYFLCPLAGSELQLILFRMLFAFGSAIALTMLVAVITDYIEEGSRGKWVGVINVCQSFGILVMSLTMTQIPAWLIATGFDGAASARYTYWVGAALALVSAGVIGLGLRRDRLSDTAPRPDVIKNIRKGIRLARANPRIAIIYSSAFVGRGDLVVITAFFSLWIAQAGNEQGLSSAQSLARAGMLFGIVQGIGIVWAPIMGWLIDKLGRVTAFCIAYALATAGYFALSQIADPFSTITIAVAVLVGISETSIIMANVSMLGQEAPKDMRGAVIGVNGVMGALGIIFAGYAGGQLFDLWRPTAPFAMMAGLNALLFTAAIIVRHKSLRAGPARAPMIGGD